MRDAKRLALELVPKSGEGEWLWILELRFVAERLFQGAIVAEREKCARAAEHAFDDEWDDNAVSRDWVTDTVAAAIRARGEADDGR